MPRLNIEVTPPQTVDVNAVLAEIERKYIGKKVTPETTHDMESEAARLIRRLIITKVTFVR
ncbi:hypothetical protein [Yersinia rohdei]|uniref:hypothetical protein n=1 Tax=Yersinia rohdei TaxID=29485 RepID=UPI0011A8C7C8|nr:hypothetical protein [Yersinia rohdei]